MRTRPVHPERRGAAVGSRSARGQAATEYIGLTTILLLGSLAAFGGWPWTRLIFQALQTYIDFYLYSLNLALG